MDLARANLVGQRSGTGRQYRMLWRPGLGDLLSRYGAEVTYVRAIGGRPSLDEVEAALQAGDYKD